MRTLLQMTLTGGGTDRHPGPAPAVWFDRVSKEVFRGLWLLPVARLLIPWTPAFSLSALSLLSRRQGQLPQEDNPVSQAAQAILGTSGSAVSGDTVPPAARF